MLIFWLAWWRRCWRCSVFTPTMSTKPEVLTIQDVVERAEAGNVNREPGRR
jgi:hypothetical protein